MSSVAKKIVRVLAPLVVGVACFTSNGVMPSNSFILDSNACSSVGGMGVQGVKLSLRGELLPKVKKIEDLPRITTPGGFACGVLLLIFGIVMWTLLVMSLMNGTTAEDDDGPEGDNYNGGFFSTGLMLVIFGAILAWQGTRCWYWEYGVIKKDGEVYTRY